MLGCDTATATGTCGNCVDGYILNEGDCQPCDPGCYKCSGIGADDCTECTFTSNGIIINKADPNTIGAPGTCHECFHSSCLTCSIANIDTACDSCEEGSFVDSAADPVNSCSLCDSSTNAT